MQLGHDADPSPSSAKVKKQSRSIPLISLRALVAYNNNNNVIFINCNGLSPGGSGRAKPNIIYNGRLTELVTFCI
jgi:hypothetical protein